MSAAVSGDPGASGGGEGVGRPSRTSRLISLPSSPKTLSRASCGRRTRTTGLFTLSGEVSAPSRSHRSPRHFSSGLGELELALPTKGRLTPPLPGDLSGRLNPPLPDDLAGPESHLSHLGSGSEEDLDRFAAEPILESLALSNWPEGLH